MIGPAGVSSSLIAVVILFNGLSSLAGPSLGYFPEIDWAQPPVGCAEEIIPQFPNRPCLDLSNVENPLKDFPEDLPPHELQYWKSDRRALNYCRAREVLSREDHRPGSFTPAQIEIEWMHSIAPLDRQEKINTVYEMSRLQQIPIQVLAGALQQESLFAGLGISEDGGNYSCGIGQVNLQEWCRWANSLSATEKTTLAWPQVKVSCAENPPDLIKPFFTIARKNLQGLPEYRLTAAHFAGISFDDVVAEFPPGDIETQHQRFTISQSFIKSCSEAHAGIAAKAHELQMIYSERVPAGLKEIDNYPQGQHYRRNCKQQGVVGAYPLKIAWLLAVGIYNAGGRAVDAMSFYNRWSAQALNLGASFEGFFVQDLIESFYGAGTYNSVTDRLEFEKLNGEPTSWAWMTACVLQRHIARVVQHVTLDGAEPLVGTFEGAWGCQAGSPPPERKTSSGQKAMPENQ